MRHIAPAAPPDPVVPAELVEPDPPPPGALPGFPLAGNLVGGVDEAPPLGEFPPTPAPAGEAGKPDPTGPPAAPEALVEQPEAIPPGAEPLKGAPLPPLAVSDRLGIVLSDPAVLTAKWLLASSPPPPAPHNRMVSVLYGGTVKLPLALKTLVEGNTTAIAIENGEAVVAVVASDASVARIVRPETLQGAVGVPDISPLEPENDKPAQSAERVA